MNEVLEFNKRRGETPLEALDRLRLERPEYAGVALSYAGRLDPLAEGVMLVLVGEANKEREKYLGLDKEYECEMLVGVATDTYDLLGLVTKQLRITNDELRIEEKIKNIDWQKYVGKFSQPYPAYSSKTVNGKPMFEYAREGKLGEIEIPVKEVEIYSIREIPSPYQGEGRAVSRGEVLDEILKLTTLVKGDFRQAEILKSWQDNLVVGVLSKISFKISCSSGTYIRSLVEKIGEDVGVPCCVFKLKRTFIGNYERP